MSVEDVRKLTANGAVVEALLYQAPEDDLLQARADIRAAIQLASASLIVVDAALATLRKPGDAA